MRLHRYDSHFMSRAQVALLIIGFSLFVQAGLAASSSSEAQCDGPFKGHIKPSPAKLAEILKQHAAWVKDGGLWRLQFADDPRRAILCGADLRS